MSELKYWLWLSSLTGVRPRVKRLLIERYGGVREVYFAPRGDYAALGGLTEQAAGELGLAAGTPVECLMTGPGGSLSAYLIRGAVIAIRRRDAAGILVDTL